MNKGYRFDLKRVYVCEELLKIFKEEKVNVQNFVDIICGYCIIWSKGKEPLAPIQELECEINDKKKIEVKVLSRTRNGETITSDNDYVFVGVKDDFQPHIYSLGKFVAFEDGLVSI